MKRTTASIWEENYILILPGGGGHITLFLTLSKHPSAVLRHINERLVEMPLLYQQRDMTAITH